MTVRLRRQRLPVLAAVVLIASLLGAAPTPAAAGDISTYAGGPDLAERAALGILQGASGLALRGASLYVADPLFHVLRVIDTVTGLERVIAGSGAAGSSGDGGPAVAARLAEPNGVAVDAVGVVLIADTANNRVRRVAGDGTITAVAGTGVPGYAGDCDQMVVTCPATDALLDRPLGVAADGAGNVYVADTGNKRVRRIDTSGAIRTVAGGAIFAPVGGMGDGGPATLALLADPAGVAIDHAGNLFIADRADNRVRRVDSEGTITTVAGGAVLDGGDGKPATAVRMKNPSNVAVDRLGGLVIGETGAHRVRRVAPGTDGIVSGASDEIVSTVAGDGAPGFRGDGGLANAARFTQPTGVAPGPGTDVFVADSGNSRVRRVTGTPSVVATVAGSGRLDPRGLAVTPANTLLVADAANNMIRQFDSTGAVSSVAGTGTAAFSGDCTAGATTCPATSAALRGPTAIAQDPQRGTYIADTGNHRVRLVDATGNISTVVGRGNKGGNPCAEEERPAELFDLDSPAGVAVDGAGNLFISDTGAGRVCKLDASGNLTGYAGGGAPGDGIGDGAPALGASLANPGAMVVDTAGDLLIADTGHGRVRRVDATAGTITTLAGGGTPVSGVGDGGPAGEARLTSPCSLALDGGGHLFVSDCGDHRLRRVDAATGIITTVAGDGTPGFAGDGGAGPQSQVNGPAGVAIDATGDAFLADTGNRRVRRLEAAGAGVVTSGAPAIASLAPDSGPTYGGTEVVITGRGFSGTTAVRFGSGPSVAFRVDSDEQITAVSPPNGGGTVELKVTTALGTSRGVRFSFLHGTWVATGALGTTPSQVDGTTREQHTATRLADGRVLVAGGFDGIDAAGDQRSRNDAELYDPAGGGWSPAASMATGRRVHAATLLDPPACHASVPPAGYPCGQVLVLGGLPATTTAELYDPKTDQWSPAAAMGAARSGATAVLLEDGRVLVAGGRSQEVGPGGSGTDLATAEIFDPSLTAPGSTSRGAWRATAPMATARVGATAARLTSGRILAVGRGTSPTEGAVGSVPTPGAEVFDPATGAWTATGAMVDPARTSHSATRLGDGTVLVVGGTVAEIYDEHSDTWRVTGRPLASRAQHTATLLEAGACAPLCGSVLVAGGDGPSMPSAELYDPGTGKWTPSVDLVEGRFAHTATALPDGTVLVAGGKGGDEGLVSLRSAELFYTATLRRPLSVEMLTPPAGPTFGGTEVRIRGTGFLAGPTSVVFGDVAVPVLLAADTVLVVTTPPHAQGQVPVRVTTGPVTAEGVFTFGPGSWSGTGSLRDCTAPGPSCTGRFLHTATLLDGPACRSGLPAEFCGRVLVAGGEARDDVGTTSALSTAQLYDPETGKWLPTGSMGHARSDHTATALRDGRILMVGAGTAEVYDPRREAFAPTGAPRSFRRLHTATLLDGPACEGAAPPGYCGKVLVVGGAVNGVDRVDPTTLTRSAELYDPTAGTWSSTGSLSAIRALHSATLLPDGRVMVTGGYGHTDTSSCQDPAADFGCEELPLLSTEVYDPVAGSWSPAGDLAVARFAHSATLIEGPNCTPSCGAVLVAGGMGASSALSQQPLAGAELLNPASMQWRPASPLRVGRAGHTATSLPDGTVLVAGSGFAFGADPEALDTAEVYRPAAGRWIDTGAMTTARGAHSATLLDGPACRMATPAGPCGSVLAVGGAGAMSGGRPVELASSELYLPAPAVAGTSPAHGPSAGGTEVVLTGANLRGAEDVRFGDAAAIGYRVESDTRIVAIAPPHPAGPVEVAVTSRRGTSGHEPAELSAAFTYDVSGLPGRVTDLAATALSDRAVRLNFAAVYSDGTFPDASPPAAAYVVKQSTAPITDASSFAAAVPLCRDACRFTPTRTGDMLTMEVVDLAPGTAYHYAVQARNDIGAGPVSESVVATTHGLGPTDTSCGEEVAAGARSLLYPPGYSLVGLPEGTTVPAWSPLYGWFDLGAGGSYSVRSAMSGTPAAGHGYWAWFACPSVVQLRATPSASVRFGLGAYHASIVGNPSTAPAVVTGHDFAARWDRSLNTGAGGYVLSEYRRAQPIGVGEGLWIFAYDPASIVIEPAG
ncbi:MAG: NHL domain-containing protein [Actinomycetota bacterium]